MISFLGTVTLFEFGLNSGSTTLTPATAIVIAPLSVAATRFAVFNFWRLREAEIPVIPIAALVERSVGLIQVSTSLATGCFVSCLFYIAVYLETMGMSSVETGLSLVPPSILFAIGSMVTGFVVQFTHRRYHLNIVLQAFSATAYGPIMHVGYRDNFLAAIRLSRNSWYRQRGYLRHKPHAWPDIRCKRTQGDGSGCLMGRQSNRRGQRPHHVIGHLSEHMSNTS